MKKKIESYQGAAGGWGAVKSVANAVRKQMDIRQDVIAMFDMNKPEGFDCPGCAWPDPKHSASFDICENGAKAIAWEVTDKQVNASFFAENTVQSLLTWGDHELEAAGRLTQPLKYDDVSDCYKPLSWQQAFDEIGARLQSYSDPNQVEFYTSGRTSNEAAFLYQLFAREYGSNNFPDCSNMCHEPTSVGLAASIGVGKGTVLLEDFEKCDLVICIGHNPGTNHPRMLTSLRALVKRGAKMIAINPLQERGLERFTAPQNPFEMLTNSETQLASAYYNVRIGGDMALLKGMMRLLIERDDAASAAGRPSLLDDEFIQTHTVGFDELRRDVLNSEWKDIERISGLSQTQIAELADAYAAAERTIICYGMGITQHEHGTQNVQQLVNLLLMKGNIGKPGAGICPLRGHSNVQGDRTVGITEKPSAEFLDRLCERYGFTPPHAPGHAAIASMQAICTGQARALICMGGNFALAMPDREASAVPLTQLDLAVHVATKLNRSHLLTARHSYILPVLGRSEIDMQKSGAQAVTVEDSMSMIHASRGVLKPAGVMLKSECAVVAGIAQAALPQSVVAWEYLVEDYDRIRNDIEAVLPEFADYNQRIRHPGGFHLINAAAERRWMTSSGKANFITSKGLLEDPSSAFNSKLVMATVRSHDQYNTTIYGMDDRYRGVFGQRDVVFMSANHAFNANILDKDYAFSDGEILMVDNAVRTHFEPYERHFKEIGFNENTIKKYLQCTNIQTVTMPVPAKFLRASNVPTGLLNEMIAYLNSEERNHHNFSELLLFSCLSIFAACKGFITLLTNGVLSVSGKVRNIVNMKLAHPWKLKDICDCLYISESLLKKKLKQEQTTFSQILLDARMQHAKNLIRVEGSVNKIAEQCGYASTSYFIYAFRKHFGNSPKRVSKEYRCQRHTGMNTDNTMNALAI